MNSLKFPLNFIKEGHTFEIFREYTDCLYSAYGTKWNGNAAAYNGSLFVSQDDRIRRLSPLECERLMGFPDEYTNIKGAKKTNRYQAIGNSWAIPVIRWIGERLNSISQNESLISDTNSNCLQIYWMRILFFHNLGKDINSFGNLEINCTSIPEKMYI